MHTNLHVCLLLVTCLTLRTHAIRVDWGTNKGPIVPPTARAPIQPQPPYREPAPVWEDQSDDIPNPNPYLYVLPPPSRPRTWPIPYAEHDNYNNRNNRNYGILLKSPSHQFGNKQVAALSPKFVPTVGWKYVAVVPNGAAGIGNEYYQGITDKLQGKYSAKTKKYKAYEKVKYAPRTYERLFDAQTRYVPEYDATQLLQQQLPLEAQLQTFNENAASIMPTAAATTTKTTNTTKTTTMSRATTTTTTTHTTTALPSPMTSEERTSTTPMPPQDATKPISHNKVLPEKNEYAKKQATLIKQATTTQSPNALDS